MFLNVLATIAGLVLLWLTFDDDATKPISRPAVAVLLALALLAVWVPESLPMMLVGLGTTLVATFLFLEGLDVGRSTRGLAAMTTLVLVAVLIIGVWF